MKVSCVTCTYRRFEYIERLISMFLAQDYEHKELIIFNTDEDHPIEIGFEVRNIKVINNNTNYLTSLPYNNVGDIRRDALTHASGDYHFTFDDDDIYLPWFISQAVAGINLSKKKAWKPKLSFFRNQKSAIELVQNQMEASVLVDIHELRKIGFNPESGSEGLSWYYELLHCGELDLNNEEYLPSYCFDWSDNLDSAWHKQSGFITDPNNFENHKIASYDFAERPVKLIDLQETYQPFFNFLKDNRMQMNEAFFLKYLNQFSVSSIVS